MGNVTHDKTGLKCAKWENFIKKASLVFYDSPFGQPEELNDPMDYCRNPVEVDSGHWPYCYKKSSLGVDFYPRQCDIPYCGKSRAMKASRFSIVFQKEKGDWKTGGGD